MKDLDYLLYYFELYEKNKDKLSKSELNEYLIEIDNIYNSINLLDYNDKTQFLIKDIRDSLTLSIQQQIITTDLMIKKQIELEQQQIIIKEQELKKESLEDNKGDDLVDLSPGNFLLGPLTKALNKL